MWPPRHPVLFRDLVALALAAVTAGAGAAAALPDGGRGPLSREELFFLLNSDVSPVRVRTLVERFGIGFTPSKDVLKDLRAVGADAALLEALQAGSGGRGLAPAGPPGAGPRPASSGSAAADGAPPEMVPDMVLIPGPRGGFFMSRYEITNRQYLAFCRRSKRPPPQPAFWSTADNLPVVNVTWHDAQTFCSWLSVETRSRYRLPTEAEWELAARGGLVHRKFPWGDEPATPRLACFGLGKLCPIGSHPPNGYGLFDMAGSVAEWCLDPYDGTRKSGDRVVKGGSWQTPDGNPDALAVAARDKHDPNKVKNEIGFRVVRER